MDKYDKEFIDVATDGKIDRVAGTEPLKKEPKKKKKRQEGVMIERWASLKKALDNSKSILDLKAESAEEPEEQPEEAGEAQEQAQPQQSPDEAPAPEEPAPPAPGEQQ